MQTLVYCENTYPFVPPSGLASADSVRGRPPNKYCDRDRGPVPECRTRSAATICVNIVSIEPTRDQQHVGREPDDPGNMNARQQGPHLSQGPH